MSYYISLLNPKMKSVKWKLTLAENNLIHFVLRFTVLRCFSIFLKQVGVVTYILFYWSEPHRFSCIFSCRSNIIKHHCQGVNLRFCRLIVVQSQGGCVLGFVLLLGPSKSWCLCSNCGKREVFLSHRAVMVEAHLAILSYQLTWDKVVV